jgi:hypothetical protein
MRPLPAHRLRSERGRPLLFFDRLNVSSGRQRGRDLLLQVRNGVRPLESVPRVRERGILRGTNEREKSWIRMPRSTS